MKIIVLEQIKHFQTSIFFLLKYLDEIRNYDQNATQGNSDQFLLLN